eukprot:2175074-Amphidinium_carterae.1
MARRLDTVSGDGDWNPKYLELIAVFVSMVSVQEVVASSIASFEMLWTPPPEASRALVSFSSIAAVCESCLAMMFAT